jgi:hypothetical protein
MEYELAKALMDAGFPQGGKGLWTHPKDAIVIRSGDRVYVPTLEELIEAAGEVELLVRDEFCQARHPGPIASAWYTGPTPIVAQARLWLALQSK